MTTAIGEAMAKRESPATPAGEALLELNAADGSRLQLYAYRSGSAHGAATVIRIWPDAGVEGVFAEYVVPIERERVLQNFFESVEARETRTADI